MYGNLNKWFFPAMLLATLSGCQKTDPVAQKETQDVREPASLVLTTDISTLITTGKGTRANIDPDDNTIQHVTLFLVDYLDDRLVAYRHICPAPNGPLHAYDDTDGQNGFVNEATGEIDPSLISGKTIRVTFDYNNTKNGLAEKLTRGTYVLLVAANYSESDKFGALGIAAEIKSLLDLFDGNPAVGISNFKDNHSDFYNLALEIPKVTENGTTYDPYIRPGDVSIPLCTTQYLHLISGVNRYNAELKRTCARMRIDVCNYSELPLTINSLEFSSNFTQSNCYLFSRLDRFENYEIENNYRGKGAPVSDSGNALTPFTPGTVLTREQGTTTVFDGLIYESYDPDNNYTYTIDVGYTGEGDITRYELANNGQPVSSLSDVQSMGPYFLIRHRNGGYLYVQNDQPYATTGTSPLPQTILDNCQANDDYYNYVWELESAWPGNNYYLRNVQTEDYIGRITWSNINGTRLSMVGKESQQRAADIFEVMNITSNYFAFRSNYYYPTAYINVWQGTSNNIAAYSSPDTGSQFLLYPVSRVTGLKSRQEVVLRTIDKTSGVVSDVHEIQRNDYIHVLVEVSYNPDKGDFEFVVNDWKKGGGEITFN